MNRRILLVEDDWFLADVVAELLRRRGWEVVVVHSAAAAMEAAGAVRPDLVLLNPRLPDQDGWQVLHAVRATWPDTPVPCIAVSTMPVSRPDLRRHAVEVFVPKPFRVGDLLQAVAALLEADQATQ